MIDARFVPIENWPGKPKDSWKRKRGTFRVKYAQRLDLLEAELAKLGAKDIVIQVYLSREDIRNDGWPRSTARPKQPGVIISFRNRYGVELSFPCDTYSDWEDNLYGIALSLEALRSVDRYGVTQQAEQYKGWAKLPPAQNGAGKPDRAWGLAHLARCAGVDAAALCDSAAIELAYRAAARKCHPDHGGSTQAFQLLQDAMNLVRTTA